MLKMFHRVGAAGGTPSFWEEAWRDGDSAESVRFCDLDPLQPVFARHVFPGSVLLEGGCGTGSYVAHHAARAVRAVGLDFATETLADVRRRHPSLLLGAADVARLPVRDDVVHTYYSGGVVEHFEAGPHQAIAEAERVLRQDGVLLISVPYFNPLRRALAPFRRRQWRRTRIHAVDPPSPERVFFQYAYTPREFTDIVTRQGFRVVGRRGYAILWGLYELPLAGPLLQRAASRGRVGPATSSATPGEADRSRLPTGRTPLVKRLVVSEDASVPVVGPVVRILRWFGANMMMYECVPSGVHGSFAGE